MLLVFHNVCIWSPESPLPVRASPGALVHLFLKEREELQNAISQWRHFLSNLSAFAAQLPFFRLRLAFMALTACTTSLPPAPLARLLFLRGSHLHCLVTLGAFDARGQLGRPFSDLRLLIHLLTDTKGIVGSSSVLGKGREQIFSHAISPASPWVRGALPSHFSTGKRGDRQKGLFQTPGGRPAFADLLSVCRADIDHF